MAIDTPPRPSDSLRIEVPATADQLGEIRRRLLAWLGPVGVSRTSAADIVLVVNEAATNCIEHAYRGADPGLVRVEADLHGRRIVIGIADSGQWQMPPPRETNTRGRGLPIMHAVSNQMELDHTPAGTTVRIAFDADAGRDF